MKWTNGILSGLLILLLAACVSPKTLSPSTIGVDPGLVPRIPSLPPLEDGEPRPLGTLTDDSGIQVDFVQNELVLVSDDQAVVNAFISRWQGKVLKRIDPADHGYANLMPLYLIRVDTSAADTSKLIGDWQTIDPNSRSDIMVSSQEGVNLLAAAAREATEGMTVAVNWVSNTTIFEDQATAEAPTGPSGYTPDAFAWSYTRPGGTMSIDVVDAWRALELAGKLGNKVKIAILDGGFLPNNDFPAGWEAHSVIGGDALNRPGVGSSIWHGTDVASAAAAVPDNGYGSAGAGSPVADLILIYTSYDYLIGIGAVLEAAGRGADIINMSYKARVPAVVAWTVEPFNLTTAAVRAAGVLLFAAAGNDNENVDAEDCFIVCWEKAWITPCENTGVICVGGIGRNSKNKAGNSNYGPEEVDIFAPYSVYVLNDPTNTGANTNRWANGTSFASPFTAGVAALIWAADPGQSAGQVESVLMSTAHSSPDSKVPRYVNAFSAVKSVLGNLNPTITITEPANNSVVDYGGLNIIDFKADVSDLEDGQNCCTVVWDSGQVGQLGIGRTIQYTFSGTGVHLITATATDSNGHSSSDSIVLIVGNSPPGAIIITPSPNANLARGIPHVFNAQINDVNEPLANLCATASWTSSKIGDPTLTGCQPTATFTSNGPRVLTFFATDSIGAKGSAQVTINVVDPPPTGPPIVTILEPQNGDGLDPNTAHTLQGTATDPDGKSPLTYEWSVKDFFGTTTVIGSGSTLSWTPVNDVPFKCGGGTVQLILKVTDPDGETGSDSIDVFISYPPC